MNITGVEVEGFGVWSGLKLDQLSDGLNVLYGPNEAGKTTLLQFVRSSLYGFSPERRKYFPPLRGGRPGGRIDVEGPNGQFHIQRYDQPEDEDGNRELVALIAADGTRQGEHLIKGLLCDVDESIFNNVFAVGLRELQELGTLGDTEAAELLYNLTAGLDRVSLVEVVRELETSRNRILDRDGGPCRIVQLIEQRQTLRSQIQEAAKSTRNYGRLATEQGRLERECARLEQQHTRLEHDARVAELAVTLRDRWSQRAALDDQLAALGPSASMPHGAVERLDALTARLKKHKQHMEQLRQQRDRLRQEADNLPIDETLWRRSAAVAAIKEQEPWIASQQTHIDELETEVTELQAGLTAQQERLGLDPSAEGGSLPPISRETLSRLRPTAKTLRRSRQQLEEAKQEAAKAKETSGSLRQRIDAALSEREEGDLATAIDGMGNLVAQFRRRQQIDERIDEMDQYQQDLEQQSRRLADRQLLPGWVLAGIGCVFVLGLTLVMVGLLMPASVIGSVGWWLALLGLAGAVLAVVGKVVLERSNSRQLETCYKQIDILQSQIGQTKEERENLDRQLPQGGGSVAARLKAAEAELAELEELAPLDTSRSAALHEAHAATGRVNLAESRLADAVRQWRTALAAAGLPEKLSPKKVRRLIEQCEQLAEKHRRLAHRREELVQRRREFDALVDRISRLSADTGSTVADLGPIDQLQYLAQRLDEQEAAMARREVLRRQARKIRRKRAKHHQTIRRLKRRRRELLLNSGAQDEQEFRQCALQASRAKMLKQDRQALDREITAAIGGTCPAEAVRELLESEDSRQSETRCEELLQRLGTLEEQLKERLQKRGQLQQQMKALAEDRQLAQKHLELATVDKRLEDAVRRWQVLAVTSQLLDSTRETYERERQPETLQEASGYLDRLTKGRYRRVWTPLGEDVLLVDVSADEDAQESSLKVEMLSRGTREQLFLAIRLALVASYARRGAVLPLVLDDVLVNFDTKRAKAAAMVLRDFAAAGHQLLVFTCHEHILKLFKSLKVPVNSLPDNTESDPAPIVFEQPAKPTRKRTKKDESAAEEPQEVEPPVEEVVVEEVEAAEDEPDEEIVAVEPEQDGIFESPEQEVPWDEEEELAEPDAELEEDQEPEDVEDYEEEEEEYEWEGPEDEEEEYEEEEEYDDEEDYEDEEFEDDDPAEAA